jgi:hypothetical protein
MFKPSCQSCRYWDCGADERSGFCRVSSPRCIVLLAVTDEPDLRVVWPVTQAHDRCGAWHGIAATTPRASNSGHKREAR